MVEPVGAGDIVAGVLSALFEVQSPSHLRKSGAIIGAVVDSTYGDIEGLPNKKLIKQFIHGKRDVIR
ncbi:hypothetical protein F3157_17485 [Virgibacillus dakarensis]|nr:hypothetical protein [Virgibacillus dakarensis]